MANSIALFHRTAIYDSGPIEDTATYYLRRCRWQNNNAL
jgi:hypothetical protein